MLLRHDGKRTVFIIAILGMSLICAPLFAQQMESEYDGKPDKKKNATYFSNGLQSKYREDTEGAIRNFEQALRFMPDDAASMYELSEAILLNVYEALGRMNHSCVLDGTVR